MSLLELPHTNGCVACGRTNPSALRLSLFVDSESGAVSSEFIPRQEHVGFDNISHGGILATVLDEAMVWAATWAIGRFCVCGELNVRYRQLAGVGGRLRVLAQAVVMRPKLIESRGELINDAGVIVASATGKFVPVSTESNRDILATLLPEPMTAQTLKTLLASGVT